MSFVDIKSLRVDAAEGDDRIFVKSTSEKFVTEIFGGLGDDTVFMSGETPPIVSNDLRGHSGLVLHDVESDDVLFDGQALFGISANVADNDEPFIVVRTTGGSTIITEGSPEYDEFQVVLTQAPIRAVAVRVFAPLPTQGLRERGAQMFRIQSPTQIESSGDVLEEAGVSLALEFTPENWFIPQTVQVLADSEPLVDLSDVSLPFFTRPEEGDGTDIDWPRDFTMNDEAFEDTRFGVITLQVDAEPIVVSGRVLEASNGEVDTDGNEIIPTNVTIEYLNEFPVNELIGQSFKIGEGNGKGQTRFIINAEPLGVGSVKLTLDRPYAETEKAQPPDQLSRYKISADNSLVGVMDSFVEETGPEGTQSLFVDEDGDFPVSADANGNPVGSLTGRVLELVGGDGRGQQLLILGPMPKLH